jgi:hypothetical protein
LLARSEGGVGLTNALHPRQKEIKKIDNALGCYRKVHGSICCGATKKEWIISPSRKLTKRDVLRQF